jgi:hypothetical protein
MINVGGRGEIFSLFAAIFLKSMLMEGGEGKNFIYFQGQRG